MFNYFKTKIPSSICDEIFSYAKKDPGPDAILRLKEIIRIYGIAKVDALRSNDYVLEPKPNPMIIALYRLNVPVALTLYKAGTSLLQKSLGCDVLGLSVQKNEWSQITSSALAAGANPNSAWGSDITYHNILGSAVRCNNLQAVQLLLKSGASVVDEGNAALQQWAIIHMTDQGVYQFNQAPVEFERLQTMILDCLLDAGADINKKTYFNDKTPLQIVKSSGSPHQLQLLQNRGAIS